MYSDGAAFVHRARVFNLELKANNYPTATTIVERCKCSTSTAHRTINRLRSEFGLPIAWDDKRQGYYLADPNYRFDPLPPGKDELTALILMRILARSLGDDEIERQLDSLWGTYAQAAPRALLHDLTRIPRYISSDSTAVALLADIGLLDLLGAAVRGEAVEVEYQSPWRHSAPKRYRGQIARLHYSDDTLYLLFVEDGGRTMVLNASFVLKFECVEPLEQKRGLDANEHGAENWLEGFGIWAGAPLEQIEIRIVPPAARYYAKQLWHGSQSDSWDGETLVRRMDAIVSPELVRRILSLGGFLQSVSPESLRVAVEEQARLLLNALGGMSHGDQPA